MNTKIFDKYGRITRHDTDHQLLRDYARVNIVNTVEIIANGTGTATVVVAYANGATGTSQNLTLADANQFCVGRNGFPHAIVRAEVTV